MQPYPAPRPGRRPSTSRADLERLALALFSRRGFEQTSVDDIAAAAGIGRRTFFRYYRSKNDVVWGEFDRELERLRRWFADCPADQPLMAAIRAGVVAFNRFESGQEPVHRQRMHLILNVPALQAHSTLRYAAWRQVVAGFAAARAGAPAGSLFPQVVGHAALAAALAGYEQWLAAPGGSLTGLLDAAFANLSAACR